MNRTEACVAAILCVLFANGAALAQSTLQVIRGDVAAVEGPTLRVKTSTGQESDIRVTDTLRVNVRVPATLDAIKEGNYVAVTATPQPDGTLLASEVRIFPESMRGTGEGHRPMAALPGRTMTNATVASVSPVKSTSQRTMTNATVANVGNKGSGLSLKVTYKGGEQTVFVPSGTPVMITELGDRSTLSAGQHVIVTAQRNADGTLVASRISIGKNGSVPPS